MANFDDIKGQGGVQKQKITGLAPCQIMAVNPTPEEYEAITGSKMPYEPSYDHRQNTYVDPERTERPIFFLIYQEDYDLYQLQSINIANEDNILNTKDGRKLFKFCDKRGNFTYWTDDVNKPLNHPKMGWANYDTNTMRVSKVGEELLYKILMGIGGFVSTTAESNFREVFEARGGTIEAIFNGNIQVLKDYVEWSRGKNFQLVLPFVVRQKVDDEGEVIYVQDVLLRENLIYTATNAGGVRESSVKDMRKQNDKALEDNRTFINNRYFTFDLQAFVLEECVNYEEAPTDTASSDESDNDMPF